MNGQPTGWALGDASVDAVLCVAGMQYMQQPEAVLGEVARVLRPGGVLIVAFSNRMFYEKASRQTAMGSAARTACRAGAGQG